MVMYRNTLLMPPLSSQPGSNELLDTHLTVRDIKLLSGLRSN
jgi:hypothetical protein